MTREGAGEEAPGPADAELIAIVGMACRFPGAENKEKYWSNLCAGVDGVHDFTLAELRSLGVPEEVIADPAYVWSSGHMDGVECFDASFFGYSPREAALMDPQHRLFLECSWAALEDAGYAPRGVEGTVGVFGGSAMNKYLMRNVLPSEQTAGLEGWDGGIPPGSSPDGMPARVSYQLGLTGPSVAVQTACSSALSAVCIAADGLRSYVCDVALAGGASVELPEMPGYHHHEGGLVAADGRCRPYDEAASGSVFGSGAGVVVLKRLSDGLADGDTVYAVLRGWAINNDGRARVGYSAPGVEGQAAVVAEALAMAGLKAADLQYVEGHGSGTPVGDSIEVRALTQAFEAMGPVGPGGCGLGSVKGNIGHVDAAAGVAGLIKTTLAIWHGRIPATLHHRVPNAALDLPAGPFRVISEPTPWPAGAPRRAGVSSFGMGGSNAHVVLEEPPAPVGREPASPYGLFVISAATGAARETAEARMAEAFEATALDPEDVAYTLATGRERLPVRTALVAGTLRDAAGMLTGGTVAEVVRGEAGTESARPVTFMFPGVGDAYAGVAIDMYQTQAVFRAVVDEGADLLRPLLGEEIRDHLFPGGAWHESWDGEPGPPPDRTAAFTAMLGAAAGTEPADRGRTVCDQPATFLLEYALARQFLHWGVRPQAMIGHSVGEYVAACVAGVLSLPDALHVIAERAKAIGGLPRGGMLAVPLPEADARGLLRPGAWIGAVNTPELVVLSGTDEALHEIQEDLETRGVVSRRVRVEHPFHSELVRPICPELVAVFDRVTLGSPSIPFISGVTGTWITEAEATSGEYWVNHMCHPVRFADGIGALAADTDRFYIELGPGETLTSFTAAMLRANRSDAPGKVTAALPPGGSAVRSTLRAFGEMWATGCEVDPARLFDRPPYRRVSLPGYPFERRRHWIRRPGAAWDPPPPAGAPVNEEKPVAEGAEAEAAAAEAEVEPSVSAVEEILLQVWRDLLGHEEISVHDDFIQLGGHSLLALQAANKVWGDHGIRLPVASILHRRTIASIASLIGKAGPDTPRAAVSQAPAPVAQNERAPAQDPAVGRFLRIVRDQVAVSLGRTGDGPLSPDEMRAVLADLILEVKRETGMQVYPEEIEGHREAATLAGFLAEQWVSWREHREGRTRDTLVSHEGTLTSPTAFVLSSPRAGSTLLRVMLAGHPDLFCPPELHLLATRDLRVRRLAEPGSERDQGIVRALMELTGQTEREAAAQIEGFEARGASTAEVFARLAELASPRILVDKSPGNARYPETLRAIDEFVPQARHIHLIRHPAAVVESMVRTRLGRAMGAGRLDPFEFGEHVWAQYNSGIQEFLAEVDTDRQLLVRYEELVTRPEQVMRDVCRTLGVGYSPEVLAPYEGRRMRDGLGDPNFLTHSTIDSTLATADQRARLPRRFNRLTRRLAAELGYELG